ncbi:hypothetical protein [Rhodopirellula sp. MGV]|uniref:hypothetical protein n=1 Tax=Rhodopirellula sp. MGV TaxID=2023130 RepID=UPI00117B30B2|nr:hypothetical protein [Rhodopirellula sp. MGV]
MLGFLAIVVFIVTVAGNAYLLVERFYKLLPEVKKLNSEIASAAATTLKMLQDSRKEYDEQLEKFTSAASTMVRIIERQNQSPSDSDAAELDEAREQCCELYGKTVTSHLRYVEFEHLYHKGSAENLQDFIYDDLREDLDRFIHRLAVLNSPELISRIGEHRTPLKVSRITVKPYYRLANSLPEQLQEDAKERIWSSLRKLFEAGGEDFDQPKFHPIAQ